MFSLSFMNLSIVLEIPIVVFFIYSCYRMPFFRNTNNDDNCSTYRYVIMYTLINANLIKRPRILLSHQWKSTYSMYVSVVCIRIDNNVICIMKETVNTVYNLQFHKTIRSLRMCSSFYCTGTSLTLNIIFSFTRIVSNGWRRINLFLVKL